MKPAAALLAAALAGCAGATLSSAPSAAPPANDAASRAFAVGTASARAVKCGFYFDPAKLKANFLAAEAAAGAPPEDLVRIEKNYDVATATMAKVIANEPDYCTELRLKYIKADLNRHLAGDFTPGPPHPKEEPEGLITFGEGGLLSGSP